jgi:hypothetical protein
MGVPGAQIAREFNKDPNTVYNLQKQGWFLEKVNQLVAERGSDAMELLRGAHTTAIQTMINILGDPMVPARVRLMAADSIIDRVAGKATQRVEAVSVAPSSDPVGEYECLLRECKAILAEHERTLPRPLPGPGNNGSDKNEAQLEQSLRATPQ